MGRGKQLSAESQSRGEGQVSARDLPKLESHLLGLTLQDFTRAPHWLKLTKHQSARLQENVVYGEVQFMPSREEGQGKDSGRKQASEQWLDTVVSTCK